VYLVVVVAMFAVLCGEREKVFGFWRALLLVYELEHLRM
jgi:hypothetical protein